MLTAGIAAVVTDLVRYGELPTAEWLRSCTDEEFVRTCSVAEWLLYHGPSTRSGSVPIARALCLAAVYVHEGRPRDIARRRRPVDTPPDASPPAPDRRPDHVLAAAVPPGYGVGDDARAFWGSPTPG